MILHQNPYNPLKAFCVSLVLVASSDSNDTEFRLADDSETSLPFV